MRTRMMALFALIAFCAMPIEAKKVKGNGDIITKEINDGYTELYEECQRLFSDKSRLNRHGL